MRGFSLGRWVGFFLCILLLWPQVAGASPDEEFSAAKAYQHIKTLSEKIGPRPAGSKGEERAAQYIYYILEQSGWKVNEQPFSKVVVQDKSLNAGEPKIEVINSRNIIAELSGNKRDTIVIGAHYDSAGLNAPGAVDNASGVAVALELARLLGQEKQEYTYQIVFFGAEENGLVGSSYYAAQADMSAVNWMLNLDMIATPLEIDIAGKIPAPRALVDQVTAVAKRDKLPFHVSRDFVMMTRGSGQGGSSDFSPFLDQNIPALGLGIAGRPGGFFHRPEDTVDRVSLQQLEKIGAYAYDLVKTVRLPASGPQAWDEYYLPFQVGPWVFIFPSLGVRIFVFGVLILAAALLMRVIRRVGRVPLRGMLVVGTLTLPVGLISVGLSGGGEMLWSLIKHSDTVWYAHPDMFLAARIITLVALLLTGARWLRLLPLPRTASPYWLVAVICLLIATTGLAMLRVDIAFPFAFWLLCLAVQWFWPNLLLSLTGPYFLYRMHWELLNSEQWFGFNDTVHRYPLVFLIMYGLLAVPFLSSVLHVFVLRGRRWKNYLARVVRPAAIVLAGAVLGLGLVPSYTENFRQPVLVQEEWSSEPNSNGQGEIGRLHVTSPEEIPVQVAKDLGGQRSKSISVPSPSSRPPLTATLQVADRRDQARVLDLAFSLSYTQEPYLVRMRLESDGPFRIVSADEFLPIGKLPKKVELKGKQQSNGKYLLVIQRTPPQRQVIQMGLAAEKKVMVTLEAVFADLVPKVNINYPTVSPEYQALVRREFSF